MDRTATMDRKIAQFLIETGNEPEICLHELSADGTRLYSLVGIDPDERQMDSVEESGRAFEAHEVYEDQTRIGCFLDVRTMMELGGKLFFTYLDGDQRVAYFNGDRVAVHMLVPDLLIF